MKKMTLAAGLALLLALALAGAAWAGAMSVTVKDGRVLDKPMVFGKMIGKLAYGTRVTTGAKQGAFYQVTAAGLSGWMHKSALTTKKIVVRQGAASSGASGSELALAGKGFNKQVESQYRRSGKVDYTWVDKMEHTDNFDGPTLAAFVRDGGLKGGGK